MFLTATLEKNDHAFDWDSDKSVLYAFSLFKKSKQFEQKPLNYSVIEVDTNLTLSMKADKLKGYHGLYVERLNENL